MDHDQASPSPAPASPPSSPGPAEASPGAAASASPAAGGARSTAGGAPPAARRRARRRWLWLGSAGGLVALGVGLAFALSAGEGVRSGEAPPAAIESGVTAVSTHQSALPRLDTGSECAEGSPCQRFGKAGECVQGRCILGLGLCVQDLDCDDANPCTADRCAQGQCVSVPAQGSCSLKGGTGQGACLLGACEWTQARECKKDKDCPALPNECRRARCEAGRCAKQPVTDGEACETVVGMPGQCRAQVCVPDAEKGASKKGKCRLGLTRYGRLTRVCRKATYLLPPEKLAALEKKLEKHLASQLRYDLRVALVALPEGGYNIIAHNRRTRREVRGLCDPSFVAFTLANFTEFSAWKSRVLHVWLEPYVLGWGVPVAGSRKAVKKGQARSPLGWLGVVEVKGFRTWLEKAFYPLPAAPLANPFAEGR